MLNVGDKVPDFTLPLADATGSRTPTAFHSFLGKGPIVIAFYPLAFTGVCTTEMCELRDTQADLATLDAQVFGYSTDTVMANGAFAKAHDMPHRIWSDANRKIIDTLWATQTVAGVERVAKRGFLIVKSDGTIAEKWVTDNPSEWAGIDLIRAALSKLG